MCYIQLVNRSTCILNAGRYRDHVALIPGRYGAGRCNPPGSLVRLG